MKDPIVKIKNENIPQNCNMVSFDVKFLFTSVPLEYTIDIIIKQIFEDYKITTIFTKSEMKKLLTLCTKNVHFSFNNEIYIQSCHGFISGVCDSKYMYGLTWDYFSF